MVNSTLLHPENVQDLSLSALGLLVSYAMGIPRDRIFSSNVDIEHALDELKEKKRIKMEPKKSCCL